MWPASVANSGNTGVSCFKKGKEFACQASEGLSLCTPLRYFLWTLGLHTHPDQDIRSTCKSLVLVLDLLEYVRGSMRKAISPDVLEGMFVQHLAEFKRAHGPDLVLPKHHLGLHLGMSVRVTKALLNCFVMERKHKIVKLYANNCHSVGPTWSRGLLENVTLTQIQKLEELDEPVDADATFLTSCLKPAPQDVAQAFRDDFPDSSSPVRTALWASIRKTPVKQNDVVAFSRHGQDMHGEVKLHLECGGYLVSIVSVWGPLGNNEFCVGSGGLMWIKTASIRAAMVYKLLPDGKALIIPQRH